jgi:putative FmdB family regulatory protein
MPTYRYRCEECGEEFETWQSMKADPLRTHDHGCGGGLVKVMSPAGIVLKGSGFYKTDNRSGSKRSGGDGGEKRSDQGDSKGDGAGTKGDGAGGGTKGDGAGGGTKDAGKSDAKPSTSSKGSDGKSSTGAATS